MDKLCAVCFEEMDMNCFEDPREQTATCIKLECDHAYHTRCIVSCLQRTQNKCPLCNSRKTPEEVLTMEGLISRLYNEVRKKPVLKPHLAEYRESKKELEEVIKQLKRDVKNYIVTRKQELEFPQKRKRFISSMRRVRFKFWKICKEKGPLYSGAYTNTPEWRKTRLIFPSSAHMHRRRFPYLYVRL
jgi:hypothetical protein